MRKTALAATALVTLALALTACSGSDAMSDEMASTGAASSHSETMKTDDVQAMDANRMGTFAGANEKMVSGMVTVSAGAIELSDFASDEGPDLHVYLTNGTEEADVAAGMQIDAVAFDKATQTFMLDGVDAGMYDTVVIYCDKAKAVFGAAELKA